MMITGYSAPSSGDHSFYDSGASSGAAHAVPPLKKVKRGDLTLADPAVATEVKEK